jgi:hypothetical protein
VCLALLSACGLDRRAPLPLEERRLGLEAQVDPQAAASVCPLRARITKISPTGTEVRNRESIRFAVSAVGCVGYDLPTVDPKTTLEGKNLYSNQGYVEFQKAFANDTGVAQLRSYSIQVRGYNSAGRTVLLTVETEVFRLLPY